MQLLANLSTDDPAVTPTLLNWTVTWQTGNKWQDSFHSGYRIDKENTVNVNYGSVNISLVRGDWPMFGQNPSNTRASSGSAALIKDPYWFSSYFDPSWNEIPASMILDGQSLYMVSKIKNADVGRLFRYPTIIVPDDKIGNDYSIIYPSYNKVQPYLKCWLTRYFWSVSRCCDRKNRLSKLRVRL
jgi:hypothetical protein